MIAGCHAEHTVSFTGRRLGRDVPGGKWEPCAAPMSSSYPAARHCAECDHAEPLHEPPGAPAGRFCNVCDECCEFEPKEDLGIVVRQTPSITGTLMPRCSHDGHLMHPKGRYGTPRHGGATSVASDA